jgi:CheY-like chemotaxis protein
MDDLTTNTLADYNESKRISCLVDAKKYYDELITKKHLQASEEYECSIQPPQQQQKLQEKRLHNQTRRTKKRILLVDDEPDICMVYQIVLQDAGFECIPYTDSVNAQQDFRPNYYDLILLDIIMPMLDGLEFCKKIRELDKNIQIIFITASEEYYEKFRSQHFPELGKINYIQKPIGNEELIRIVNMIIANSITTD